MTRHERCEAVIASKTVDRLPRYLPGISCDVASKILGRPVNSGTGSLHYAEACAWMNGDAAHAEFEEKLLEDLAALYRALDIDVYRMPWRETAKPDRRIDEFTFLYGDPDSAYVISQYSPVSGDFGAVRRHPSEDSEYPARMQQLVENHERQIAEHGVGEPVCPREHAMLVERFGREFFVVCNGGGISAGWTPEALMLLIEDPELVARHTMLQARSAIELAKSLHCRAYPNVLVAGGDMAGNDGPIYSPATFRSVMLPAMRHLATELQKITGHYIFRSDGNLWSITDMLFGEAACPGYGEVDRDAGMSIGSLRKRFPKLVFWGNFSVSRLTTSSLADVRDEACRIVEESGGSGYFHGPSNAIMKGTPPENVEAMFGVV